MVSPVYELKSKIKRYLKNKKNHIKSFATVIAGYKINAEILSIKKYFKDEKKWTVEIRKLRGNEFCDLKKEIKKISKESNKKVVLFLIGFDCKEYNKVTLSRELKEEGICDVILFLLREEYNKLVNNFPEIDNFYLNDPDDPFVSLKNISDIEKALKESYVQNINKETKSKIIKEFEKDKIHTYEELMNLVWMLDK